MFLFKTQAYNCKVIIILLYTDLFCFSWTSPIYIIYPIQIECKFGLVNGGERVNLPNGGRPLNTMKQNNENHWYESVTEPLYEDSRTFSDLPSIKEGQLPNELPTRNYFTHQQQRNLNKVIATTRTHKGVSLLQTPSSHATVIENRLPKKSPVIEQQQMTDQATIQRWLNTNGYKLSDLGLSDKTTSEAAATANNIQVFESPDRNDIGGEITKSYTDDVLSKIGLNSDQAMVTTDVAGAPLKRPSVQGSSSRKEKVSKKKQKKQDTTKHSERDHQKNTKANTSQRLAKIANLISLLKDYSNLKHKKRKNVPSKSKHSNNNNKHQQRQTPVIPHHEEIVTSSEEVQEDETAASDKEAKMKGALMRFSTQSKLDGDYQKSLKSTSSLVESSLSSNVSPHHLVTVDTTTGKIYAERMIPHEDFDELGFAFTGGSKKTSLGFIPQQNTAENGVRRAKTPVEPASSKKKMSTKKHKSGVGKASARETLLKRIGKQLSFISTDQLKRLDSTLDKLKHLHKKH